MLGTAVAAVTGTVADGPPRPSVPSVAPRGYGDDRGGGGGHGVRGGTGHGNSIVGAKRGHRYLESELTRLGGEVSRQLESVAAGERKLDGSRHDGGGRGAGGGMLRLREEVRLVRAEETAILVEIAERRDRVARLTDELCDAEDAVAKVGGLDS